jgi:hypothetical protein
MILDLSFPVLQQATGKEKKRKRGEREVLHDSADDTTVRMAPEKPVKELGNVLSPLLRFMQEVPAEEHILFSKIDLADGYWRMVVEKDSRWNFAYVLPGRPGSPLRLLIPSALQMGGMKARPIFVQPRRQPGTLPRRGSMKRSSSLPTSWSLSQLLERSHDAKPAPGHNTRCRQSTGQFPASRRSKPTRVPTLRHNESNSTHHPQYLPSPNCYRRPRDKRPHF